MLITYGYLHYIASVVIAHMNTCGYVNHNKPLLYVALNSCLSCIPKLLIPMESISLMGSFISKHPIMLIKHQQQPQRLSLSPSESASAAAAAVVVMITNTKTR